MENQSLPIEKAQELIRVSLAFGAIKWADNRKYSSLRLAYHPFTSTQEYFDSMGDLQTVWQNVFFKVAKDPQFISKLFAPLAEGDEMIRGLLSILKKKAPVSQSDGILLDRIDYFNDEKGQPKLTEYNLIAVGLKHLMQRYRLAKQLCGGDQNFVPISNVCGFSLTIREYLDRKKVDGVLLYVIYAPQSEAYFDQLYFEVKMRQQSIRVIRTNLKEMAEKLVLHQNGDLYFEKERVSVVYYRSTYQLEHFVFGEHYDINKSWEALEKVELSNAVPIPSVEFRLINQKRAQTELGKLEVLRKYATEEEANMLMKTRVQEWEFDSMSEEELQRLTSMVKQNPKGYILKPNLQAGGNNIFDEKLLNTMSTSSLQELRSFILMQRIIIKDEKNWIVHQDGNLFHNCGYEVSRYGTLCWINGEIVRNKADSFLIRAKLTSQNQTSIMTGMGGFALWKIIY